MASLEKSALRFGKINVVGIGLNSNCKKVVVASKIVAFDGSLYLESKGIKIALHNNNTEGFYLDNQLNRAMLKQQCHTTH
jgi:hypothetical protein